MRRCTKFKGIQQAAKLLFNIAIGVAGNFERFIHDVGTVVSNGAARQLYEGAGFTPSGVRPGYYADPKEDALIYWRHESDHPVVPAGLPSG